MGYMHIENLYRPKAQAVLQFKRVFALEKIHGTSAHVAFGKEKTTVFSGGVKHEAFAALFGTQMLSLEALTAKVREIFGEKEVTVFGEAYGGSCQGMKATYGELLRFVAFDVCVDGKWLNVPRAVEVVDALGVPFVAFEEVEATVEALDRERDRPSRQAQRNGIEGDKPSEGIVIRPPFEVTNNAGGRVIAKHKRPEFSERATQPPVNEEALRVYTEAQKIADEWVTEMRLTHVLDKLGNPSEMSATPKVIEAMVEDVAREAAGEILDTKESRKAIGAKAAKMFKARVSRVQEDRSDG